MLKEETKPCTELFEKVLIEMCSDGYSPKSVEHHVRPVYHKLAEYCKKHFEGMYSVNAGKAYMEIVLSKKQSKDQTALNRNTIERLDHALDGDFHWRPAKSKLKPYATSCYDAVVAGYEAYLIKTGAGHIHDRFIAANDKAGFRKAVKMFFRYACRYGLVEYDVSQFIPPVPRHKPVPSVYTGNEIVI